jgi:hypothetical protein
MKTQHFSLIKLIDGIIVVPTSYTEIAKYLVSCAVFLTPLSIEEQMALAVIIKAVLGGLHYAYKYTVFGDFVDGAKKNLKRKNYENRRKN